MVSLVGTVLEREGYRVVCTTNPQAALRLAADPTRKPDLLMTDVTMPELTGPGLAKAVQDACPAARILFMTAHYPSAYREHGIPPDADVLRKPFRIGELVERVRMALAERKAVAAC